MWQFIILCKLLSYMRSFFKLIFKTFSTRSSSKFQNVALQFNISYLSGELWIEKSRRKLTVLKMEAQSIQVTSGVSDEICVTFWFCLSTERMDAFARVDMLDREAGGSFKLSSCRETINKLKWSLIHLANRSNTLFCGQMLQFLFRRKYESLIAGWTKFDVIFRIVSTQAPIMFHDKSWIKIRNQLKLIPLLKIIQTEATIPTTQYKFLFNDKVMLAREMNWCHICVAFSCITRT